MQRSLVPLLLRLPQRTSLALALPLLTAYAPECFRGACYSSLPAAAPSTRHPLKRMLARAQLHVFVRIDDESSDFCKVAVADGASGADAGDLKLAVIAALSLSVAPYRLRLLRQVEGGGTLVPLDSRKKLAIQGVTEGASVLVQILPETPAALAPTPAALAPTPAALTPTPAALAPTPAALAPTPAALAPTPAALAPTPAALAPTPAALALPPPPSLPPRLVSEEVLGGERTVVVNLEGCPGIAAPHPFFLTLAQFSVLERFLKRGPPFDMPSMLMVTGTIKSGKSRIVQDIIPRLLTLYHSQAPAASHCRPAFFHHVFTDGISGTDAAEHWLASLQDFARSLGIALARPLGHTPAQALPKVAQALARRIHEGGGKLWLLFDELGAPIVASSSPREADAFVQLFKDTLAATSPYARTVATGSGMVSLLKAFSAAPPNGFTLWGATSHMCVGQEPRPPLALAMAQRLHSVHAHAWQPGLPEHATPQRLLHCLAYSEHGGLTSPRPALLAFLASSLREVTAASPAEALRLGLEEVLKKLHTESQKDAAAGLERMSLVDRQALRALALHGLPLKDYSLSSLAAKLCEAEWVVAVAGEGGVQRHLLPPYGSLLQRWVRPDGLLSIQSGSRRLVQRTGQTLVTLQENRQLLGEGLVRATSEFVLQALAEQGIGVPAVPGPGSRPPTTVAELVKIPAIGFLLAALEHAAALAPGKRQQSPSARGFRQAEAADAEAQDKFMAQAGLAVLLLLRNYCGHVSFATTEESLANGLTEAALDYVVHGAAVGVVQDMGHLFFIDEHGALLRKVALPVQPVASGASDTS